MTSPYPSGCFPFAFHFFYLFQVENSCYLTTIEDINCIKSLVRYSKKPNAHNQFIIRETVRL